MTRTTMTALLGAGALMAALTGCGGSGGDDEAAAPRPTAASSAGSAPAAADPGVVVALDDFAATGLLTLGVEPDLVLTAVGYTSTEEIFRDRGLTTAAYGSELDLEQIAAAAPDIIVGVSLPTTASLTDRLEAIAPTTVLDYTAGWEDQLRATAAAVGRDEAAEEVIDGVGERAEALREDLEAAGRAGDEVSVLAAAPDIFSPPVASGLGSVLASVGLERPAAQTAATTADAPFVPVTEERLTDHGGDVLYLLAGGTYDTATIRSSPLFARIGDGALEVSGEVWLSPSAFAVDWVLRDLRATLLEDGTAAPTTAAAERFAEFTDGTS